MIPYPALHSLMASAANEAAIYTDLIRRIARHTNTTYDEALATVHAINLRLVACRTVRTYGDVLRAIETSVSAPAEDQRDLFALIALELAKTAPQRPQGA